MDSCFKRLIYIRSVVQRQYEILFRLPDESPDVWAVLRFHTNIQLIWRRNTNTEELRSGPVLLRLCVRSKRVTKANSSTNKHQCSEQRRHGTWGKIGGTTKLELPLRLTARVFASRRWGFLHASSEMNKNQTNRLVFGAAWCRFSADYSLDVSRDITTYLTCVWLHSTCVSSLGGAWK